jgi:TolB protein
MFFVFADMKPVLFAILFAISVLALAAADLSEHKLLVTSVRTGNTEVFIADPETGDMFNVTRAPNSEDRYPCWSPDGQQIAFCSDRNNSTNLYVCCADGSDVRRLITSPAVCYMPSWQHTPAGERIVLGMHGEKPEMASVRPDGTDLRMLGLGHDPTLSPNGKWICYTGEVPGGVSIFVMNANGENKRRIITETSQMGATFPNWSPDSRQIVYSFPVGDALELFVTDLDGAKPDQLTRLGQIATPSAWAPDGAWISFRLTDERYWRNHERMLQIYRDKPADKRPVWIIRPDGSDARLLEPLHYQMAIDGSRAAWKPMPK